MIKLTGAYERILEAIAERPPNFTWIVAFSGGKDSSLVLKLFWSALARQPSAGHALHAIYCDTGSENPLAGSLAQKMLGDLAEESSGAGVAFSADILRPPPQKRLLVKIVGRGYPPPNTFFRWCTKELRIRPVEEFMARRSPDDIVVLGVRSGESRQRDRSFGQRQGPSFWSRQVEGKSKHELFLPIADFSTEDVWDALHWIDEPVAISASRLWALYEKASGECPVIRAPESPPCGGGRFGCWLCTVVRRDRSAEHLIGAGHSELQPLMTFREWLLQVRNDPKFRCTIRRSGARGLGPFRLAARQEILDRLNAAQDESGLQLLSAEEHTAILAEWREDRSSPIYSEDWQGEPA